MRSAAPRRFERLADAAEIQHGRNRKGLHESCANRRRRLPPQIANSLQRSKRDPALVRRRLGATYLRGRQQQRCARRGAGACRTPRGALRTRRAIRLICALETAEDGHATKPCGAHIADAAIAAADRDKHSSNVTRSSPHGSLATRHLGARGVGSVPSSRLRNRKRTATKQPYPLARTRQSARLCARQCTAHQVKSVRRGSYSSAPSRRQRPRNFMLSEL